MGFATVSHRDVSSSISRQKSAAPFSLLQVLGGLAAFALAFHGLWSSRAIYLAFLRDNDGHCLTALFCDLTSGEFSMRGWQLTPAPYFFPDMPVFFATAALARNFAIAYCVYAAIMLLALFAAFYFIIGLLSPSRPGRLLVVGWAALVMALCFASRKSSYQIDVGWFLMPGGHGGGAVVGILLIGLGMRLLERPSARWCVVFGAGAFCAMVSDALVLPHYLLPLLVGAFLHAARRRTPILRPLVLAGIVAAVQLASKPMLAWAQRRLNFDIPALIPTLGTPQTIIPSWHRLAADLPIVAGLTSPLTVLLILSIVAAIAVLWIQRGAPMRSASRQAQWSASNFSLLASIACVSTAAAIAMPIVTAAWANRDCVRYVYPVLLMPLLILPASALAFLQRLPARASCAVAWGMTVSLALFCGPWLTIPPVDDGEFFDTPQVRFIDSLAEKYHLHAGYGDYWWTKPITLFSRHGVVVNEILFVNDQPVPRWWINNPNRWSHQPKCQGGDYPIYDFTIFPAGREPWLVSTFGPPAAMEQKAGLMVYIYNRPNDVLFRNYFRTAVLDRKKTNRRHVISNRALNLIKEPFYPVNGPGVQMMAGDLTVMLDRDGSSDFMEIGLCSDGAYRLDFKHGSDTVGTCAIPAHPGIGIQPHKIDLVPIVGGKKFDAILIHPADVGPTHSVGYVFIFDDPMLHPEQQRGETR